MTSTEQGRGKRSWLVRLLATVLLTGLFVAIILLARFQQFQDLGHIPVQVNWTWPITCILLWRGSDNHKV